MEYKEFVFATILVVPLIVLSAIIITRYRCMYLINGVLSISHKNGIDKISIHIPDFTIGGGPVKIEYSSYGIVSVKEGQIEWVSPLDIPDHPIFKIKTNGLNYTIKKLNIAQDWEFIFKDTDTVLSFNTYDEAVKYIRKTYGTVAEIAEPEYHNIVIH